MLDPTETDPRRRSKGTERIIHDVHMQYLLWILRTGAPWDDLPSRFGKRSRVSNRYTKWKRQGLWDRITAALQDDVNPAPEEH